jgi:hypothetical protein
MLRKLVVLMLLTLLGPGCALMPPKRIPADRVNYLEAINTSWKEQLLNNLVMLRKGDSLTFLELTQVTTTYNLGAEVNAGYSAGVKVTSSNTSPNQYQWLSEPGTSGISGYLTLKYSRNPAVVYSPVRGESLRKIMMDPISLAIVFKSLQVEIFAPYILPLAVESITVESPKTYLHDSDKFSEFVRLFNKLRQQGIVQINIEVVKENTIEEKNEDAFSTTEEQSGASKTRKPQKVKAKAASDTPTKKTITTSPKKTTTKTLKNDLPNNYLILNDSLAILPDQKADLKKFKNLLRAGKEERKKYQILSGSQLERPKNLDEDIGVIFMQTRSIMQVLVLLAKPEGYPVAVPELEGPQVRFAINESAERPRDAFVTIRHGGLWYYIDNNDNSKKVFSLIVLILAMSEPADFGRHSVDWGGRPEASFFNTLVATAPYQRSCF